MHHNWWLMNKHIYVEKEDLNSICIANKSHDERPLVFDTNSINI